MMKGDTMEIQPFVIDVPQPLLDDLQERLARTRWPDEVEDAGWDYGTNLTYLQALVAYWRTHFDWRAQERAMNTLPHFRAEVDGVGIHFIHAQGRGPAPLPLLITHGWPIREPMGAIPQTPLTWSSPPCPASGSRIGPRGAG
jgi:hypothetical protein